MAYSSPVPDLLGSSNVSSDQVFWEEQSHGLLSDGSYGLQDIHIKSILTNGKKLYSPIKTCFKRSSPQRGEWCLLDTQQHSLFFSYRGWLDELEEKRSK